MMTFLVCFTIRIHLDDMATDKYTEYSGRNGNAKRARSASPEDDIYDMEQRKIFEMANSPEPKNIGEYFRKLILKLNFENISQM